MRSLRQRVHRLETEALPVFAKAILELISDVEGIRKTMATKEDFSALSAAVDTVATEISVVAGLLSSGQDNNNQVTIDALTGRLTAAAEALKAAIPADAPSAPAVTASTAVADTVEAPASDATDAPADPDPAA